MQDLDLKDRKILYELDVNSRQSLSSIAKKVGLSKEVVNYRIKNLVKKDIITSFYTLIDTSKLGYFMMRVYFTFMDSTPEIEEKIIKDLITEEHISWIAKIVGTTGDMLFGYWAKELDEFYNYWLKFKIKYSKYINTSKIAIFTNFTHYQRQYLLNEGKKDTETLTIDAPNKINLDDLDISILKKLSLNSRATLLDLSNELKISPKVAEYRIKQLTKKKVILGYKISINLAKLDYYYFKIDIYLNDLSKLKYLETFALMHPNVVYHEKTIGGSDFEFDIEVPTFEDFQKIMDHLKSELKGALRSYTFYEALKIHLVKYMP